MTTPYVRFWYAIAVSFVACVVFGGAGIGLALWFNDQSQKRAAQAQAELAVAQAQQKAALCKMVVLMDDAWRETPPSTSSGRNLADAISSAREILGCPAR